MRRAQILAGVVAALVLAAPALASDSYTPGTTLLVSRAGGLGALPAQSDNDSWTEQRAISADGHLSVFVSNADDLGVAGNLNHAYVRDDQTGAVTLLDRAGPGGPVANSSPFHLSISADGSKACFASYADNLVPGVGTGHVYVVTIATGAIVAADRAGNGDIADYHSFGCSLDASGDAVAFASDATNLGGGGGGMRHVYVRNLNAGTTTLVDSYQGTPGDKSSGSPSIDGSGQTVAFETVATNLNGPGGDQNAKQDVYVRFLGASQPVLVSRAGGGGGVIGNGDSGAPSISAGGKLVAFVSYASNFGDGDADMARDIHVRDLLATTTTLVSRADGAGGAKGNDDSYSPEIAGDGSAVAFLSEAHNLGTDPGQGNDDDGSNRFAYVRTLTSSHTTIVSRASGASGALDNAHPGPVSLDHYGVNAIFSDRSPGLDPLASGAFSEVFQRHLGGDFQTRLISRPADGSSRPPQVAQVGSGARSISADGRFVVFSTRAPVDGPGGVEAIYVRDVLSGTARLVSRASGADGAPANAGSSEAAISADGTKVAFVSSATNLADGVSGAQIYVRDLVSNTTTLASTGLSGPGDGDSSDPVLSQDGSRIAFRSHAANLVDGDANGSADIFVRDLLAGTTVVATFTVAGGQPDADAYDPEISADGTRVAWVTDASNMGAGTVGGVDHAYVRDLAAATTTLVDRAADGSPSPWRVSDSGASMSADGNRFAFESMAKLTPGASNTQGNVYVRDIGAGTTTLASIAPDGSEAAGQAWNPSISLDGTKVTFSTGAPNFPGTTARGGVWMRDLGAGTTTLISARDGSQEPSDNGGSQASLNADGSCVVFRSIDATLASPSYAGRDFDQLWLRVVARECPIQAPDTTITSGPSGSTRVRTAVSTFGYKADESNVTFACSLDGAPAKPCGDTFATPKLRDGVQRFSVAATDRAGNTDPTPAFVTFTVGVPPRVTKLRLDKRGRLVFRLSERAKVRVRVARISIKRSFKGGTRRVRLPMKRLRKGHRMVTATVIATDAGGNRSVPKRKRFSVRR